MVVCVCFSKKKRLQTFAFYKWNEELTNLIDFKMNIILIIFYLISRSYFKDQKGSLEISCSVLSLSYFSHWNNPTHFSMN